MKWLVVLLWFTITIHSASAQHNSNESLQIKEVPKEGFWFIQCWKYQAGDNLEWVKPAFDDKKWQGIEPFKDVRTLPELWKTNIGWFRLHFKVDSNVAKKNLNLLVQQTGTSENYLNGQVQITAKDNGIGIPQQAIEKIFQPFFTTKPTEEGTGLGLPLSYDIVKAHGGELQVKSTESQGSCFVITLPTS